MTAPRARSKFIIGGAIIVLAVGYLIVSSIGGATAYYLTIEEVKANGPSERTVRVAGNVVGETIEWNAQELMLRFNIADASGSLTVAPNHLLRPHSSPRRELEPELAPDD